MIKSTDNESNRKKGLTLCETAPFIFIEIVSLRHVLKNAIYVNKRR